MSEPGCYRIKVLGNTSSRRTKSQLRRLVHASKVETFREFVRCRPHRDAALFQCFFCFFLPCGGVRFLFRKICTVRFAAVRFFFLELLPCDALRFFLYLLRGVVQCKIVFVRCDAVWCGYPFFQLICTVRLMTLRTKTALFQWFAVRINRCRAVNN